MNAFRLLPCTLACALSFIVFPAAQQANAQNLSPRPAEMQHITKLQARAVANPGVIGRWDTLPFDMPINPVHVALMYSGKVLIVSGSGNDPDNKNFQAAV